MSELTNPKETPSTASVKVAAIGAVADNFQEVVKQFGGILGKLLEVAKSNPLVGLWLCIIMTLMIEKNGWIPEEDAKIVKGGLYAIGGISITGGVISLLTDFLGKDAHQQLLTTSLVTDAHSEPESRKVVGAGAAEPDDSGQKALAELQKILPLLTQLAATAA